MRVAWTAEAEQDRADIWEYIVAEDPLAAVRMDTLFSDRMVYEIDVGKDAVWILALVHTARRWPPE